MISDRLRARADRLAGSALHNKPFPPQECAALAHELLAWAKQVEIMEITWFTAEALSEPPDCPDTKRDAA